MSDPIRIFHNIEIPGELKILAFLFKDSGHQLFLVGGAVRDALMGVAPKDFDVATDAEPDQVIDVLRRVAGATILEIGKAFGVIKIVFPSGFECEVATFRKDIGAGRRPDAVEFTTIEHDVMRRDLTINALFFDLHTHEVVDFVGGIADIKNQVVRTVGRPEDRFNEDRLRILRAVRFAAQFGCELDFETEMAIQRAGTPEGKLEGVSPERIRDELLKAIAKARSVTHLMMLISRLGLWFDVMPGVVVNHQAVRETRHVPTLLALMLREQNSSAVVSMVMNKLKWTVDETKQVCFLLDFAEFGTHQAFKLAKQRLHTLLTDEEIRRFAELSYMMFSKHGTARTNAFLSYKLSVSGQALLDEGFNGKELGAELERRETKLFSQLFQGFKS